MTHKIVKEILVFIIVIISTISISTISTSAHLLETWANNYPASSANTTYSFGLMKAHHIDGNNVKYYWANSSAKSNFSKALTDAFLTSWKNLITGTEVSSEASANVILKYDPINQPTYAAAVTTVYLGEKHYGVGSSGTEIIFYRDIKNYSYENKRIVAAHELGHLWGIDDLYNYDETLDSIYSHAYDFTYATRHDRNAMRICLNDLWYNPGKNQVWSYQSSPGTFIKRADVNQDGTINAADARAVLRYSAQLVSPTSLQMILADVDGNGSITAADSQLILRYSSRLESKFPTDVDEG